MSAEAACKRARSRRAMGEHMLDLSLCAQVVQAVAQEAGQQLNGTKSGTADWKSACM